MNWNDRSGAIGCRVLDQSWIKVGRGGINIRKHRRCTGVRNRLGGRNEGIRGCNHLIAGANTRGQQGKMQRIGAGIESHAMLGLAIIGE